MLIKLLSYKDILFVSKAYKKYINHLGFIINYIVTNHI